MSLVEIGASALTPEKVYELLHTESKVVLDSSVPARFTTDKQIEVSVSSETKESRDSSLLALILQLLNTDNSAPLSQIQSLIDSFHNSHSLENTTVHYTPFTASELSYLVTISTSVLTFAYALFAELSCTKSGAFLQEKAFTVRNYNQVAKTLAEEIRIYANNSKKHDIKKGDQNKQFINIVSLRENDIILRQKSREEVKCGIFTEGIENQIDYQFLDPLNQALQNAIIDSQTRQKILESFTHTDGNWKPIPPQQFTITPLQPTSTTTLATLLYTTLTTELTTSLSLIKQAQSSLKKGKLQIGETILLFLNNHTFTTLSALSTTLKTQILPSTQSHRLPLPPPGTRDLLPHQMHQRKLALQKITEIFEKHGALAIDTPAFETRQVLMGKYGEDQKLIFNLENFGEEQTALRYDLTVPFSRFCATNGISAIKRYQIGRVYRRDKPVIEKGRFREFYQCDFDVAGTYAKNAPDAEVLCVVAEILQNLRLGEFEIVVSDRRILDAVMRVCGVSEDKLRAVCGCVDQLDKVSSDEVVEKIVQKGVQKSVAEKVLKMLDFKAGGEEFAECVESLKSNEIYAEIAPYLSDLSEILSYLTLFNPNLTKFIKIDFSLARGLDYYTGMIFEAKMTTTNSSIAGGGRYDKLLPNGTPSVGGSVGIERIFALLEEKSAQKCKLDVFIAAAPGSSLKERIRITGELQQVNVKVSFCCKDAGSLKQMKKDIDEAVESGCRFCVFQGGEELERGVLQVKDLQSEDQVEIGVGDLVGYVLQRLGEKDAEFRDFWMKMMLEKVQRGEMEVGEILEKLQVK